tara:strand:- start:2488 stop:3144 length:657 start_codon:yes stop_codon:yes gene_type:complete
MKILIIGHLGKMGVMAFEYLSSKGYDCIGCGREDDLVQLIKSTTPDVLLDLTHPEVVFEHAQLAIESQIPIVIGTSGLRSDQIEALKSQLKEASKVLIVPNFSISALLMMKFTKIASNYFDSIEIIEGHHPEKKDKPSGTARMTAQLCDQDVTIHSRRQPGLLAEQAVYFGLDGETLCVSQRSLHRGCFMPGILLAIEKVFQIDGLMIGLEDLLLPQH